jgi:hypothetical protein
MAQEQDYFELEIEMRSVGEGFEAQVLSSPYGRGREPFVPPLAGAELAKVLADLERTIRTGASAARDLIYESGAPAREEPLDAAALGRQLFAALFTGKVERRFHECMVDVKPGKSGARRPGFRVRLTFSREEDFARLAAIPWELLRDDRAFLALDRRTPIVRSIDHRTTVAPVVAAPLRILAVDSRPKGVRSLDTGLETRKIRSVLRRQPGVELTVLRHPSVRRLRDRLLGQHVLHFMGHGGYRRGTTDELVLWFEGEKREAQAVTGPELAEYIKDLDDLRLVVLNACWGGALPRAEGQDPLTGVAAALMARDIPAVVAMQFPISDQAAIGFGNVLYQHLAQGAPLSAAVAEARLEILSQRRGTIEWATPVVFLAGGHDRIFMAPSTAARAAKTKAAQRPPAHRKAARPTRDDSRPPLRLAVRSFHGFVADAKRPDDLLDLTAWFDGRYIRRRSFWRSEIFPRLCDYLLAHAAARRPIVLDFAAHSTIAFAAGYCLEAKSGLDVTLLQRTPSRGTEAWGAKPWSTVAGPAREGQLWRDEADIERDAGSPNVALAVGVTWPVLDDVMAYLEAKHLAVGRIIPRTVYPKPGPDVVQGGLHALQLAQDLAMTARRRSPQERAATLHLFASAPNAVLFYLGQLGRSLGTVQLHEHDFDRQRPGAYIPSLRLPITGARSPAARLA